MSTKLIECGACKENFSWDSDIIEVNYKYYHKDCVDLYPIGHFAMLDDEPLGETENEDGSMAFEILEDGEYEEDEE